MIFVFPGNPCLKQLFQPFSNCPIAFCQGAASLTLHFAKTVGPGDFFCGLFFVVCFWGFLGFWGFLVVFFVFFLSSVKAISILIT